MNTVNGLPVRCMGCGILADVYWLDKRHNGLGRLPVDWGIWAELYGLGCMGRYIGSGVRVRSYKFMLNLEEFLYEIRSNLDIIR